jgi:PST family polysaccharide transporter
MGWVISIILALPLSQWSFGDHGHAIAVAILGGTILLGQISAGQAALIQGMRRIGDLARQTVIGAAMGTTVSLTLYAIWGRDAIVPALLMVAACTLLNSWWFARRISIEPVSLSLGETIHVAKRFVTLGLAFMYAAFVVIASNWAIQSLITRRFGEEGNGIYSAAWSMSTQFAAYVLLAMAADFYPRLSGLAHDHLAMNRLINEQTEIGILLALPGLIATLACGPWVIRLFYSSDFLEAANLLPWFVLGVFGRVISWPLAYSILALRHGKLFAVSETAFAVIQVGLVYLLAHFFGLQGVAVTFTLVYVIYAPAMRIVAGFLTGFHWSRELLKLLVESLALVITAFVLARTLPPNWCVALVGTIALIAGFYCVRGLTLRLGPHHRATRLASRIPWLIPRAADSSS